MQKRTASILFIIALGVILYYSPPSQFMLSSNLKSDDIPLETLSIRFKTPPEYNCFVFETRRDLSRAKMKDLPDDECYTAANGVIYVRKNQKKAFYLIPSTYREDAEFEQVKLVLNGLYTQVYTKFTLPKKASELFALYPDKTLVFDSLGRSVEISSHFTELQNSAQDFGPGLFMARGGEFEELNAPKAFFEAVESFERTRVWIKRFPALVGDH